VHTAKRGWWRRLRDRLSGRREHSAGDRPRGFISHDAATAGNGAGTPAGGAGMGGAGMGRAGMGGAGMGGAGGQHSLGHRLHGGMSLRPGRSRLPRWLQPSRFAPLLIVAGIIGVGLGPARGWVTSHLFGLESKVSSDFHQRFVDIVPFRSEASSAAPGHGAKLAIDGVQQTYWLSGPHDGVHARLTIVFPNSEDIDRIGLLAGEPGGDYRFQARPETVKVSTAGQAPVMVSFDDTAGFQNIPVSLHGVTSITITVKKVYAGQKGQAVAVREIEFFNQV
jgi:hypothetical protein